MKHLGKVIAGIGVIGLALVSGVRDAQSLTASDTASATATINTVFTIALDTSTVPFGTVAPGSTTALAVVATCKTNAGNVWYLKVKYNASQSDTTLNFKSSGGAGTNDTTFGAFSTTDQTTYTSTSGEGNNLAGGTAITVDHQLVVAAAGAPGAKSWTVTYTFTETV